MKNRLEKASFIVLLITIVLTPIVFVPSSYVSLDVVKTVVITGGILLAVLLYIISSFKDKNFSILVHPLFKISSGIILSLIISALISDNIWKSLFGQGFEIATVSFIIVLFVGSLLTVYLTNKDRNRIVHVFGAIFTSFIIIALFHLSRLILGSSFLSSGIFNLGISTMLGKWNDLALFSGVVAILSYITLRFAHISRFLKVILVVLALISTAFIFLVNSSVIWGVVLVTFAFMVFAEYMISPVIGVGVKNAFKKIPVVTCIIFIFITIGFWKGGSIVGPSLMRLDIIPNEVSLPWQLTLDISSETIKESPLFGAGPNRFMSQYLKFKPVIVNSTVFWMTEFGNGFGLVPSFVVTQGIVGIILWLSLIIYFVYTGFKAIRAKSDEFSKFFIASTFFSSLFLWIATLVYVPSHAILFITFILSGLFVASLVREDLITINIIDQNNKTFILKLIPVIFIVLIFIIIAWLSIFIKKEIALSYFQAGISVLSLQNNQSLLKAESNFKEALNIDKTDTYYQALSEVNLLKITVLSQEIKAEVQKTGGSPDQSKVRTVVELIDQAVKFTQEGIKIDPTNYYNYIAEARISELALSLQIPNAYENARNSYINALKYNPYNPSIYLNIARIDASQNKMDEAKKDIVMALQLKQNYIDAIFLLSQIQVAQGQIKEAITSVQAATRINSTNPLLFFQLGLLYYNDKNYTGAVDALSQALKLDRQYANAQYFLGLSYARLYKIADAIVQFENLSKTNPDSQEVALILSNLRSNKSPFSDAKPPIDSKPEKRRTLPIPVNTK